MRHIYDRYHRTRHCLAHYHYHSHAYLAAAARRKSRTGANEVILADTSMLIPVAGFLKLDSIYLPCYLAHPHQEKDNATT